MAFSLHLPTFILRSMTLRSHRRHPRTWDAAITSPEEYFLRQLRDTPRLVQRFLPAVPFTNAVVMDVGGGLGGRAPAWLNLGASRVWNVDINRPELDLGQRILARVAPTHAGQVHFAHPDELSGCLQADVALLVDAFEHLEHPREVLDLCARHLAPGGLLWIGSIGWYNYMASHCLGHIPLPWCQVLFSDRAIIDTIQALLRDPAYRRTYWDDSEGIARWDGISSLKDRPGEPLNQLSLRRIRRALRHSEFELQTFQLYPPREDRLIGAVIRPLLRLPVFSELFHGYYTAVLRRRV